jgi:membrane protease YdiL (CAAX protease family)
VPDQPETDIQSAELTGGSRAVRAIVLYVASILILGALLAPVFKVTLDFVTGAGFFTSLADAPFKRIANRAFMVVAIVGLWPLTKGIGRISKADLGLAIPRRQLLCSAAFGFLIGAATMGILVAVEYASGIIVWDARRTTEDLIKAFFSGIVSGIVISLIEEPVFRGFFHNQFCRRWGLWVAAVGSAILYAFVHFIRSKGEPDPVTWYSGFEVLASAFRKYGEVTTIGPFIALLIVGIWLSLIREHTGHLGWGIGLHAGWVAVIRVTRKATNLTDDPSLRWLADGYDQITGWLAAAWLLILTIAWYLWSRKRSQQ